MINPVYNISPGNINEVDWLPCQLVMEMNDQYFLYVVLKEHVVLALKYYAFSINTNYPLRDQLYEIVKADEVLHKQMNNVSVIYNFAESCLIPEPVYNADINSHVMEFVHGDLKKGLLLNEKVHGQQIYNVFNVPEDIHHFFQTGFPTAKFWHYFTLWMQSLRNTAAGYDVVHAVFYPNIILVAVRSNGKFLLIQTLQYQTPEDAAFHLLNIFHQFGFDQEDTPIDLGGLVDTDSSVFEELLKYFQIIHRSELPAHLVFPEGFNTLPPHFFSPLLKLALCAL